jgi:antitoxin (DNA-binding transcriptional repressor) of toxin-antitoxin stability system
MTIQVELQSAPTLEELIRRVKAGDEIVIASQGKPLVRISNEIADRKAVYGGLAGIGRLPDDFDDPLPEAELKEWGL